VTAASEQDGTALGDNIQLYDNCGHPWELPMSNMDADVFKSSLADMFDIQIFIY
jgi:hypothetical protein